MVERYRIPTFLSKSDHFERFDFKIQQLRNIVAELWKTIRHWFDFPDENDCILIGLSKNRADFLSEIAFII